MNKVLPRWAVCAFFAVFLALGLLTAADYGPSWDEQTEMDILRMNLWEYARVLGLDESRFETLAARQGPLSIETLRPISQSIEQDHGTAAFYPFGWVVLDLSLTGRSKARCGTWPAGPCSRWAALRCTPRCGRWGFHGAGRCWGRSACFSLRILCPRAF